MAEERLNSIADKIKKLFALSASNNPEEAALATERARQLLEKYNLTLTDVEIKTADMIEKSITLTRSSKGTNYKNLPSWSYGLLEILNEHFYVKALLVASHLNDNVVYILGARKDVEVATYVFNYLFREVETLCNTYLKQFRGTRGQDLKHTSYSYKLGAIAGIEQILTEQRSRQKQKKARTQNGTELVVIKNEATEKFVNEKYPHIEEKNSNPQMRTEGDAIRAGIKEGRNIQIHRGVKGSQKSIK